jgi:hypothetical protein
MKWYNALLNLTFLTLLVALAHTLADLIEVLVRMVLK